MQSRISTSSAVFRENRDAMLAKLTRVRELEKRAQAASEKSRERFASRAQVLPRERVSLLLDPVRPLSSFVRSRATASMVRMQSAAFPGAESSPALVPYRVRAA